MEKPVFLDANIIMYAIGKDHPFKNPCRAYLEKIKSGELTVVTNTEVMQEILHRYFSIGMPEIAQVALSAVKTFCNKIYPIGLPDVDKAHLLLKEFSSINARDAIHAATMLNNDVEKILSTDAHFDVIRKIKRIKP